MPDNKLSAREAALIAQARAELGKEPAAQADTAAPVATAIGPVAPAGDPAERAAALMAAARAETGRHRRRQKLLYLWVPFALMFVTGLWTLLWMWHKL